MTHDLFLMDPAIPPPPDTRPWPSIDNETDCGRQHHYTIANVYLFEVDRDEQATFYHVVIDWNDGAPCTEEAAVDTTFLSNGASCPNAFLATGPSTRSTSNQEKEP